MKTLKKIFFVAAIMTTFAASLPAQVKNLKIATIAPSRSAWDFESKKLAAEWAKVSNNQIVVQYMNANAMGGEAGVVQKLNSIRPGQKPPIDGAIFTSLGVDLLAPGANLLTLDVPFMLKDSDEVDYVVEQITPRVDAALAKKGYKFLGLFNVGWCYFYTKKPVHTPHDLKTQKLSVSGVDMPALTNAFKSAGYLTIDVPPSKLLTSLRTPGGAEGFYTLPMYAYAGQYYKSLPYILDFPLFPIMACLLVSKSTWDSIPETYKPGMLEALKTARDNFTAAQKTADKEYMDRAASEGCTIIKLNDAEREAFREEMIKDTSKMIESGVADVDFYNEIQIILKKYRGQ